VAEYSYNGWLASKNAADFGGLEKLVVAGESFAPGVRAGDVHTVLEYVATQLHLRVEPVVRDDWHQADDWGYSYRRNRNANNLSCHSSGTAFDYNATRHPNGKANTFSYIQVKEIRKILVEVDNVVKWGGDFSGTKDEMHFEICKDQAAVARVAARLRGDSSSAPPTSAVLKVGSRGPEVERLQLFLNRVYPSYSNLVVDGDFGPATEKVVKEFQRRSGLAADGVVGPATRAKLGI
jgi:hypothetical protein